MCRHVLTGVDFCGSVYLLIGHRNALENACLRAHKPENRLKTFCFCFLRRGPGPSEVAGGGPLTETSKTFRLDEAGAGEGSIYDDVLTSD